jgi:hypothetical protein
MASITGYMRATDSFSATLKNGEPIMVSKGELAHPDHPVVKQFKHLFESAEGHIRLDRPEKATRAPGEKRAVGRKRVARKPRATKKTETAAPTETRGLRSTDLPKGA